MAERWVLNASPLIVLALIGHEVLRSLRATGFYLDVQTAREALIRTVGEEWPPDSS